MALTREPSGSRASTSGWLLSIRRPTWATIRSMIDSVTLSEMNRRPGLLDHAAALDVDLIAGHDHDFRDRRRPQQVLQRPEAENRVLQVLLQRAEDEVLAQLVVQVRADEVEHVVEAAFPPAAPAGSRRGTPAGSAARGGIAAGRAVPTSRSGTSVAGTSNSFEVSDARSKYSSRAGLHDELVDQVIAERQAGDLLQQRLVLRRRRRPARGRRPRCCSPAAGCFADRRPRLVSNS